MPRFPARALLVTLIAGLALAVGSQDLPGATKVRPILVLPYHEVTPGGGDGWFGEGIAETLVLAAQTVPALMPIDRGRVLQAAKSAGVDLSTVPPERAAAAVARALRADFVFYGEFQRTADGGVSIVPRLLDPAKPEGQTLDALVAGPDRILDVQADVLPVYAKALRLGLKPDELQRAA